ncbi:MAG: SDR family NAD(P)-dependent oxidoreductase [Acidimicrobiaceae bacterium]|nr:SDR family NAD(P)-dependent oxidoreductase [Acidimicrobiaceae bacterium]MYI37184.1 SDR family NAD(P)-dependent oxidoreductase [Acidimicrobiaceae bacterium]
MKDLAGRVAVVTGGASGMGRGMAERFAAESMQVVVADIEEPPLHETVQSIRDAGGEALAVTCDVSSWPSVEALRNACAAAFGPADVLCNNAGVAATGPISELSLKSWEWCLGVNLWGVIHGCRAFLPSMIERGSGHVVNTASVLGHITSAGIGPYNVSKHGVVALSETLHAEMLADGTGVGVTCLCPGLVSTNILDSERNRPEHLQDQPGVTGLWDSDAVAGGPESEMRAAIRDLYAQALRPSVVADMVVRAIRGGELWLFTDHDFDGAIAARHRSIEDRRTPDSAASLGAALLEDHDP